MPQLHAHTFPSQIFWLVVSFVLLYLLMRAVALPRIEKIEPMPMPAPTSAMQARPAPIILAEARSMELSFSLR